MSENIKLQINKNEQSLQPDDRGCDCSS